MLPQIPFILPLRSSVWQFQLRLKGLSFVKKLEFGIIMQQTHFYKAWLRSFASVEGLQYFKTINPCRPCRITCANFSKSGYFSHALSQKQNRWPPIIFAILTQVTHYLAVVEIRKKAIDWKILREHLWFQISIRIIFYYFMHYWHLLYQ